MATSINQDVKSIQHEDTEYKTLEIEQNEHDDSIFTQSWSTKNITECTVNAFIGHKIRVKFFKGKEHTIKDATLTHTGSKWKLAITKSSSCSRDLAIVRGGLDFFNSKINSRSYDLFKATLTESENVEQILKTAVNLNQQTVDYAARSISTLSNPNEYRNPHYSATYKNCRYRAGLHMDFCRSYPSKFNLCDTQIYSSNFTALHFAVFLESTDNIKLFLEHGTPIDVTDRYGVTPLFYAALHCNKAALIELLKHNPSIKQEMAKDKFVLLTTIMRKGRFDVVKLILNHIHKMPPGLEKDSLIEKALKETVLSNVTKNVKEFLLLFPKQWLIIDKKSALIVAANIPSTEIFFLLMEASTINKKWGDDFQRLNMSQGSDSVSGRLKAKGVPQTKITSFFQTFSKKHEEYRAQHPEKFIDATQKGIPETESESLKMMPMPNKTDVMTDVMTDDTTGDFTFVVLDLPSCSVN